MPSSSSTEPDREGSCQLVALAVDLTEAIEATEVMVHVEELRNTPVADCINKEGKEKPQVTKPSWRKDT